MSHGHHALASRSRQQLKSFRAMRWSFSRWDVIRFDAGATNTNCLKQGEGGLHRLQEDEPKALEQARKRYPDSLYILASKR
ncbi:MAG: hypothetical protein EA367_01850 [Leptolyngbya sp. DLM2.Bin15]|nr:MAG: hypothetical protein EA367_01850 [Leptolyngbya sp. DLM2.Bin15]